jgi:hypothetical protein
VTPPLSQPPATTEPVGGCESGVVPGAEPQSARAGFYLPCPGSDPVHTKGAALDHPYSRVSEAHGEKFGEVEGQPPVFAAVGVRVMTDDKFREWLRS